MKLATFIDEKIDSDVMDIIYHDENGRDIEIDPFKVLLSEVIEVNYQKIVVIKIKKT